MSRVRYKQFKSFFYEISIRGLSKNIIYIICFLSKSFNFLFAFSFFQSFIALCNFNSSVIMFDFLMISCHKAIDDIIL